MSRCPLAALLAATALLAAPAAASADDGDSRPSDDVRVAVACTGASRGALRVRDRDDALRVELDVSTRRRGATWTVVIVHERRLAFRGRVRTSGGSGSFSVRRSVADWFGEDTVVVRATGPAGETCRATATL